MLSIPEKQQIFDEPVVDIILQNINQGTPTIHGRIDKEYEEVLKNIAVVSKKWRKWVFDLNTGPFKALGNDFLFPDANLARCIGIFNQNIMKRPNTWFKYVDAANKRKAICPSEVNQNIPDEWMVRPQDNPNVLDLEGHSPYSRAVISLLTKKTINDQDCLLQELYAAGISDVTLAMALIKVLTWNTKVERQAKKELKHLIKMADIIASRIKNNGNGKLIEQYLKPNLNDILSYAPRIPELSEWLEKNGIEYTVDTVCHLLEILRAAHIAEGHRKFVRQEYIEFILHVFEDMDIKFDKKLESGEHLIHFILKGHGFRYQFKSELVQLILEKYPKEINIPDTKGKGVLSILFDKSLDIIFRDLKDYINDDVLNDQKNELRRSIKMNLKSTALKNHRDNYDTRTVNFFSLLKEIFPSKESFENWLLEIDEESLLHVIAFWHPSVIDKMLEEKLITPEMCENRNNQDDTVSEISERQSQLFQAFQHPELKIEIDSKSYICFNKKMKEIGKNPFIFDLFEQASQAGHLEFPLLDQLIHLQRNITNSEGDTLLHAYLKSNSCTENKIQFLHYLIDHGVNPKILNNEGKSALDIARDAKKKYAYPYLI